MCDSDQGSPGPLLSDSSSASCGHAPGASLRKNETCGGPQPVSAATSGPTPFDLVLQKQRFATMMDFLPELLELFRANAGEHLDAIRTAFSRGELPEAATAAHTLKGMSSVVCATTVQELSGQLENILNTGDSDGALPVLVALETQLARAIASLNAAPAP